MANLALTFDLLAKDSASGTFRKVGDEAERAGNKVSGAVGGVNGALGALKTAGAALAGAAIAETFVSLYDAAAESARIGRLTTQVIQSTGGAAKISAGQVGDLAGAIAAKTGIDDEAIQSGENLLLTFTNIRNEAGAGNDIFDQTTQIMTDMSAALGTDASGSAIQLGKALNDPIKGVTALTKVGVSFTQQQKDQIETLVESGDTLGAQKVILAELAKEFGGAAEAAATPLDKLKVSIGNIAEALGSYLIPIVDEFAGKGLDAIQGIGEGFSDGATDADGFKGAMQDLGGVLHDVVDVGTTIVHIVGDVVGFFKDLPGPIQIAVGAFAAFNLLKGPVGDAFDTISLKALYAADSIGTAASGGLRGAAGGLVTALGGPVALAVGAVTVGLGFLIPKLQEFDGKAEAATDSTNDYADALRASNGAIDENVRAGAAKDAQDRGLLDVAGKAGISLSAVTDALTGNSAQYDLVSAALQNYANNRLIASGYEQRGSTTLHDQSDAAQAALGTFSDLAGTLGTTAASQAQLADAVDTVSTSQADALPTTESITQAQQDLSDSASDTKRAIDGINTALEALTGQNVSTAEAEAELFQATQRAAGSMDGLSGNVLDSAGSLNTQSESGNAAMDVLYGVRDAGNQLDSTLANQGATTAELTQRDADLRQSFIDTAEQMGISEGDANNLADGILGIPSERLTTITANTDPARRAIEDLVNQQYQVIVGVTAGGSTARATAVADLARQNGGRAAGGEIYGPGTGTSDSILGVDALTGMATAWVSSGEYVTNKKRYDENRSLVQAINAGLVPAGTDPASLKYLAGGGLAEDGSRVGAGFYDRLGPGIVRAEDGSLVRADSFYGNSLANFAVPVTADTSAAASGVADILSATASAIAAQQTAGGDPGSGGGLGSTWNSLFSWVQARIPEARVNSAYRPGDPGYHGLGKAVDFGFGSKAGGNGSAGLASINRLLFDTVGGNLAELIYDGLGDDRGDLKNGRTHTYDAATSAEHHNHVHAAVYDDGGLLQPGYTLAYNGTKQPETIRTAEQEAALSSSGTFTGSLYLDSGEFLGVVRGVAQQESKATLGGLQRITSAQGLR